MNDQPIEKQRLLPSGALDVHSVFYTIQGEGPFVGRPSVFVRLAGCNLQCPRCDTDYTSTRTTLDPSLIVAAVKKVNEAACLVVITGGEPFRQNITPLVNLLLAGGFGVQIETNGTLFLHDLPYNHREFAIVCSPKAGKVHPKLAPFISAYKYVLRSGELADDGLPLLALDHPASPRVARPVLGVSKTKVYVQPVDEQASFSNQCNLEAAVASSLKHGYTLGIQMHKLIGKE